jgi:hypothetical protein
MRESRRYHMSGPIYKLFLIKPKSSSFRLSKGEQDKLLADVGACLAKVGAKSLLMCTCSWSSEQWAYFGVEEFPDMDAVQRHSGLLGELNWPFGYCDSFSILGTRTQ